MSSLHFLRAIQVDWLDRWHHWPTRHFDNCTKTLFHPIQRRTRAIGRFYRWVREWVGSRWSVCRCRNICSNSFHSHSSHNIRPPSTQEHVSEPLVTFAFSRTKYDAAIGLALLDCWLMYAWDLDWIALERPPLLTLLHFVLILCAVWVIRLHYCLFRSSTSIDYCCYCYYCYHYIADTRDVSPNPHSAMIGDVVFRPMCWNPIRAMTSKRIAIEFADLDPYDATIHRVHLFLAQHDRSIEQRIKNGWMKYGHMSHLAYRRAEFEMLKNDLLLSQSRASHFENFTSLLFVHAT